MLFVCLFALVANCVSLIVVLVCVVWLFCVDGVVLFVLCVCVACCVRLVCLVVLFVVRVCVVC